MCCRLAAIKQGSGGIPLARNVAAQATKPLVAEHFERGRVLSYCIRHDANTITVAHRPGNLLGNDSADTSEGLSTIEKGKEVRLIRDPYCSAFASLGR